MSTQDNRRLRRKVRTSYAVSTVSIAMVLFLLGSVSYLAFNTLGATDRVRESVAVNVMLRDSLDSGAAAAVGERLLAVEGVREAVFIPKDVAARDYIESTGDDFTAFLDHNPLPDSWEVRLAAGRGDDDATGRIERQVAAWPEVREVVYQRGVAAKMANLGKINLVVLMFGAALLVISLVLLNNTIRITVFSKRYIINTMKLVGATRWFVMKPFLRSSLLQGIYAALIATALFAAMVAGLREGLPELGFAAGGRELLAIVAGMTVVGVVISLVFTLLAVNKFVRMRTNAIYLY